MENDIASSNFRHQLLIILRLERRVTAKTKEHKEREVSNDVPTVYSHAG